jgi:hypothetical protein
MTQTSLTAPSDVNGRLSTRTGNRAGLSAQTVHNVGLGLFPLFCLTNSLAFLVLAASNTISRDGSEFAPALLWLGILIIFAPTAMRLISTGASRRERIGLVLLLGCSLYMVKVMHSPLDFTFHDEFLHWRTTNNIISSTHLFTENSILPVSALYPGLEIIAAAVSNLTGLSVVDSGVISLGLARAAFMLALFLFYERIGGSARLGGVAALLYTCNSNFIFFDSQFSYETLSLPIATTVLYAIASRDDGYEQNFLSKLMLALPLILFVAITHHLTGYVMGIFILLWTVLSFVRKPSRWAWFPLAVFTAVILGAVLLWNSLIGETTSSYLLPVFIGGIKEALDVVFGGGGRQLFQSSTGSSSPVWERVAGIASVLGIISVLPIGILQILWSPFRNRPLARQMFILPSTTLQAWQRYRNNAAALALALMVLIHPIMQVFRLTSAGWEIANRSSEFLFWAIAFVLAVAALRVSSLRIPKALWMTGFTVWACILFVGGAISGWPPWGRQPGSYMVSADTRSIEPEGIQAAKWVGQHLPAESRMTADRINTLLMSVYGHQRTITHLADDLYLASVFFTTHFGPTEVRLIKEGRARYLVADLRLNEQLPMVGVYFEGGEPRASDSLVTMDLKGLTKFDYVDKISRLYDGGDIRIYDLGALDEPS